MLRKLFVGGAVTLGLAAGALSLSAPAANAIPINDVTMTSFTASSAGAGTPSGSDDVKSDVSYVVTHMGTEVLSKNVCTTKPSPTNANRLEVLSKVFTPRVAGNAAPADAR